MCTLGMAGSRKHFPGERLSMNIANAITNTTHMHISCANSCLATATKDENFIGVCFFAEDGNKVFIDRGHRIRSGYIYVEPASNIGASDGTAHKQTMEKIFSPDLCNESGVAIVGFAQKDRKLVGRSGTLNDAVKTNLVQGDREMFFLCRTPIFGALLIYKICAAKGKRVQNICANSSSIALIYFLLIRRNGSSAVKSRYPNIDIEQSDIFSKELYNGLLSKCKLSIEQISKKLDDLCDNVAAGIDISDSGHTRMLREIEG